MLPALLNFLIGGGLLALVQAALTAWNLAQAKQAGANAATLGAAQKVIADVATCQTIDRDVAAMPASDVASQLREFERPEG